jgi:hypothetical protein
VLGENPFTIFGKSSDEAPGFITIENTECSSKHVPEFRVLLIM